MAMKLNSSNAGSQGTIGMSGRGNVSDGRSIVTHNSTPSSSHNRAGDSNEPHAVCAITDQSLPDHRFVPFGEQSNSSVRQHQSPPTPETDIFEHEMTTENDDIDEFVGINQHLKQFSSVSTSSVSDITKGVSAEWAQNSVPEHRAQSTESSPWRFEDSVQITQSNQFSNINGK